MRRHVSPGRAPYSSSAGRDDELDDARSAIEAAVATWPDDVRAQLLAAVDSIVAVVKVPYDDPPSSPTTCSAARGPTRTPCAAARRRRRRLRNDLPRSRLTRPAGSVADLAAPDASTSSGWSSRRRSHTATRRDAAAVPRSASHRAARRATMLVRAVALVTSQVRLRSARSTRSATGRRDAALAEVVTRSLDAEHGGHDAVPLVARPPRWPMAEPPARQPAEPPGDAREEPEAVPDETRLPRPRRRGHPQGLPPARRRGHRTPGRRGDRPALPGHPRPAATQGQRPRRHLTARAARSGRPSSSRWCCSTTRRRSR